MTPNRNMVLFTSHIRGPPESPWKQKKNTLRYVFLTVLWRYFHLPRPNVVFINHQWKHLVYLASIFLPVSTSCAQHVFIDLILAVILVASILGNKPHLSLFQISKVLKATLKKNKKTDKNNDDFYVYLTFYIVLVLAFNIDVQSDKMTWLLKCPATFSASMSCHNHRMSKFDIFHIIDQLCGYHVALISCCCRKMIIVIILGYTI